MQRRLPRSLLSLIRMSVAVALVAVVLPTALGATPLTSVARADDDAAILTLDVEAGIGSVNYQVANVTTDFGTEANYAASGTMLFLGAGAGLIYDGLHGPSARLMVGLGTTLYDVPSPPDLYTLDLHYGVALSVAEDASVGARFGLSGGPVVGVAVQDVDRMVGLVVSRESGASAHFGLGTSAETTVIIARRLNVGLSLHVRGFALHTGDDHQADLTVGGQLRIGYDLSL